MLRDKIGALIIKEKMLLLVSDDTTPFFWIPGGKIEEGEDHEACLRRELAEELGLRLKSTKFYATKRFHHEKANDTQTVHYYVVEVEGKPQAGNEITRIMWYAKENFERKEPKTTKVLEEQTIPQLIGDSRL
jgi:ADP-ribose pyrophosphatase YjhB (NUDIX family)